MMWRGLRGHYTVLFPAALMIGALLLPSCQGDGHFTILGYTTRPNYDPNIHSVYVPIFQNRTLYRGWEFPLTRAVIREIQAKTPFRIESDCSKADTELICTIATCTKNILNRNQLNEVREAEMVLGVEVVWRDRRTGEVLSQPRPPGALPYGAPVVPPLDGTPPLPPPPPPKPAPVLVQATGNFIPELGGSITTGQKDAVDRLAIEIVSLMEKPW
jgi:hypothetical protein